MKDELIGLKLAHYRIDRFIGRGGMAQVYYAWDESLDRPAAVKVINADLRGNDSYTDRFVQEARAIAKWRHPNVLQVYYAGQQDDLYFFAMEYIDGLNLEEILNDYAEKGELIPHDDVIHIGRAIASALDYAHDRHVIHRDVKPSNAMIDKENRVVLADFGLAMDIQRGTMGETFGTPHYVAPEQARNSADAVPQSDLYSLGVILYEMLTGVVPFDDPSSMSLALKHLTEPPPPPRTINPLLSEEVEAVLLKALEKEPANRYASGNDLLDALTDALRAQTEDNQELYALPPAPVSAGERVQPARPISHLSVADRVALSIPEAPTRTAPKRKAIPSPATPTGAPVRVGKTPSKETTKRRPPRSPSQLLNLGGVGVIVILILAAATFLLLPGTEGAQATPEGDSLAAAETASGSEIAETTTESAAGEGSPAATESDPSSSGDPRPTTEVAATTPNVEEPVTETAAPTETKAAPTATALPPTPTTKPTNTPVPPTNTPLPPTNTPVPPTNTPPPPPPPSGRKIQLIYNARGFYLHNTTGERIPLGNFHFEALNEGGNPARFAMSGGSLARFYGYVEGNFCARVEAWGSSNNYQRPPECGNRWNVTHTPHETSDEVFWIQRPSISQFRVLWSGQEIARCPLADNTCTIYVP